jgi:hypothetical protein
MLISTFARTRSRIRLGLVGLSVTLAATACSPVAADPLVRAELQPHRA